MSSSSSNLHLCGVTTIDESSFRSGSTNTHSTSFSTVNGSSNLISHGYENSREFQEFGRGLGENCYTTIDFYTNQDNSDSLTGVHQHYDQTQDPDVISNISTSSRRSSGENFDYTTITTTPTLECVENRGYVTMENFQHGKQEDKYPWVLPEVPPDVASLHYEIRKILSHIQDISESIATTLSLSSNSHSQLKTIIPADLVPVTKGQLKEMAILSQRIVGWQIHSIRVALIDQGIAEDAPNSSARSVPSL